MKVWYIYTVGCYLAVKNITKFSGKFVDLENIILSEVHQKDNINYRCSLWLPLRD